MWKNSGRIFLGFLGGYVAVATLFFCLWSSLVTGYNQALIPLVNFLMASQGLPAALEQREALVLLAISFPDHAIGRFEYKGYEGIYLQLVSVVAAFCAMPFTPLRVKLRGLLITLPLLWLMHSASLYGGLLQALAGVPAVSGIMATTSEGSPFAHWAGLWSIWGTPVFMVLMWAWTARDGLGLAVKQSKLKRQQLEKNKRTKALAAALASSPF